MTALGGGYERKPEERKRLIVNEQGEFVRPSDLQKTMGGPLFSPYSEEEEQEFLFDDDLDWRTPVNALPVQRKAGSRPPVPKDGPKRRPAPGRQDKTGGKKRGRGRENRPWKSLFYVFWIALCFLGMCVLGVMMMPQMAGYFWKDFGNYAFINGELLRYDRRAAASYRQYKSYMAENVIYPGVFVDGISVGGMTVEEARGALSQTTGETAGQFSVTVAIGDKTWKFDSSNVPSARNLGNVLEKAYAIGRTNTVEIQATQQTPFRQRVNTALALREQGVNLTTTATYDHDAVRTLVDEIAAYVTRDPIDAQILTFDYKTRSFTFSSEQPGVTLDADLLYERVCAALDKWEKNATVTVDPVITQPSVTKDTLAAGFTMVAAYTTTTTKDSNRNTNIRLACEAINGTALMPGETFSFNQATGQRTVEKGYKSAGAIAAGQSIEEVGGGICQVSSTIFNAVARANLEIVERSPHAWPSSYVNKGEDATVNWPNLDFKFKNNTDYPVFLITYYEDRKMSAEIWGMSLGEGVSIDLESQVIRTMDPPTEIKYVYNSSLPYGTNKTTVKARTGYVVETYKVWYKNGEEFKREILHTSTYRAYQQTVEYND